MKNMRIFIRKRLVSGGGIFNIFEQECFRNDISVLISISVFFGNLASPVTTIFFLFF